MNWFLVLLWLKIGVIGGFLIAAPLVTIAAFVIIWLSAHSDIGFIRNCATYDKEKRYEKAKSKEVDARKGMRMAFLIGLPIIVLGSLVPNTKELATIIILPKIANSEFVQEELGADMKDMYSMAKGYIAEQLGNSERSESSLEKKIKK